MGLGVDLTTQTLGNREYGRNGARKFGVWLVSVSAFQVEAAGGFENGGYRKVMEQRRQQEAERWAEQGAASERERERLNAEEARRQHEAAHARRRQGM